MTALLFISFIFLTWAGGATFAKTEERWSTGDRHGMIKWGTGTLLLFTICVCYWIFFVAPMI